MKKFICGILLALMGAVSTAAVADTITLFPTPGLGSLDQFEPANDAVNVNGAMLRIRLINGGQAVAVYIEDDSATTDSNGYCSNPNESGDFQTGFCLKEYLVPGVPGLGFSNRVGTASDGSHITFSFSQTKGTRCGGSGRGGGYCHPYYTLVSGSIVR